MIEYFKFNLILLYVDMEKNMLCNVFMYVPVMFGSMIFVISIACSRD